MYDAFDGGRPRGGREIPRLDNRRTGPGEGSARMRSAAFWQGWMEHKNYLLQLALRWMSGNHADAEDLLSRACLKAHDRYLRDAPRIRKLRPWLARLLHNVCMDEHRKRAVRNRVAEQFHPEQLEHLAIQTRAARPHDEQNDVAEAVSTALDAIIAMPNRLRHPFVLRFIYQYSNQEIARHLALTEVNVRKRIQLGRSLVRERLGASDILDEGN